MTMRVQVHYTDGSTGTFDADNVETVNDVAYIDGILQTDVDGIEVGA